MVLTRSSLLRGRGLFSSKLPHTFPPVCHPHTTGRNPFLQPFRMTHSPYRHTTPSYPCTFAHLFLFPSKPSPATSFLGIPVTSRQLSSNSQYSTGLSQTSSGRLTPLHFLTVYLLTLHYTVVYYLLLTQGVFSTKFGRP